MAHANKAKSSKKATRLWDQTTIYGVHPMQCATSALQESKLDDEIRFLVAWILILHDILEDTTLTIKDLPSDIPDVVVDGVRQKSYGSTAEEREKIWGCAPVVILATLYDKRSNLLDNDWMKNDKLIWYCEYVLELCRWVEGRFGTLNVVVESRALMAHKLDERGLSLAA